MDRREILNELQHIVAITDTVGSNYGIPEASRRAKGLIREVESWPIAFPPAPYVSDQCAQRQHADCPLDKASPKICHCACHLRPQDRPPLKKPFVWTAADPAPPEPPEQAAEPAPAPERHIDTPDELLELLAGVSSDPQIEGLSLAQKASTMALLYVAKALQQIAYQLENIDTVIELTGGTWLAKAAQSPTSPQEPS